MSASAIYILILVFTTCGIHGDACSIAAVPGAPAGFASLNKCEAAGQSAVDNYSAGDEAHVSYTCTKVE